jgi:hypothetical protein
MGWYKLHVLGWDKGWDNRWYNGWDRWWDKIDRCRRLSAVSHMGACDGIAAAGDKTILHPCLDAPANPLTLPAPSASEIGVAQLGLASRLGADPGDRRLLIQAADWPNVVIVLGGIAHSNHGVPF